MTGAVISPLELSDAGCILGTVVALIPRGLQDLMRPNYLRGFAQLAAAMLLLNLGVYACTASDEPKPTFTRPTATVNAINDVCDAVDRAGVEQLKTAEKRDEIASLRDKAGVPETLRTALAPPTDMSTLGLTRWRTDALIACKRVGWAG